MYSFTLCCMGIFLIFVFHCSGQWIWKVAHSEKTLLVHWKIRWNAWNNLLAKMSMSFSGISDYWMIYSDDFQMFLKLMFTKGASVWWKIKVKILWITVLYFNILNVLYISPFLSKLDFQHYYSLQCQKSFRNHSTMMMMKTYLLFESMLNTILLVNCFCDPEKVFHITFAQLHYFY